MLILAWYINLLVMRSLQYIFIVAFVITIYAFAKEYFDANKEASDNRKAFTNNLKRCYYDPFLKTKDPFFVGSIGYIVPNIDNERDFSLPWKINTFLQTGPTAYTTTSTKLPERTKVKVLQESVVRRNRYSTYIKVQCLDTLQDEIFIIRGDNFSELDYWNCSLEEAIIQGPILGRLIAGAELPINNRGEWVNLSNESIIICKLISGLNKELIIGYAYDLANKKHYNDELTFKKETVRKLEY